MAALRNAAIGALRAADITKIAAASRHHAFAGALVVYEIDREPRVLGVANRDLV